MAGSCTVCSRSMASATQPTSALVLTMRPEPLPRLFAPLPAVLSVITWSSCRAAIVPVPTVTVAPTGTPRNAPSPVATEFRKAPVSSKSSNPMSIGPDERLVQRTAVSTRFLLMTAGMITEDCARCPSLKVGSGVSIRPPRADGGRARSTERPAARPSAVQADRTMPSNAVALALGNADERQVGEGRWRDGRDRRIHDHMHVVGDDCRAGDVLGGPNDSRRAVLELVRPVAARVERDRLVLVEFHGRSRPDRHRHARGDVDEGAVVGCDRVPERPRLVEQLHSDVDGDRVDVGADEVGL